MKTILNNPELYVVLDNIRSRENVGSIFRTADGVGVNKIYLCGITPIPPHEKISKAALGAEQHVSWEYRAKTWQVLRELKNLKFEVVGLEQTKSSKNVFEYKSLKNKKIALIVGNEVQGISPKILKYCSEVVHIPMRGKKESLNVSVATGVALYTLCHK